MKKSLLAIIILCLSCCASATTWYVDVNAPDDPVAGDPSVSDPLEDGTAAHPFDAIQEAIDAAANGDIVLVDTGTYSGEGNRDIDFLGKAITVQSEYGPNACRIYCQGSEESPCRGFIFQSGETHDSILDGFTIINGYAPTKEILSGDELIEVSDNGGGILCRGASPRIMNCRFTHCTAYTEWTTQGITNTSGGGGGHQL